MPRQPRVEFPGAIYHVTVRMVGPAWEQGRELTPDACLFRDDAERERFLLQLGERVEDYGVRLFAYCLMLSHVHLYLETPKGNLGRFMHSLSTAYTVYSNLRRRRHGPLVGRYKAKLVEGDNYHLVLSRYVHLNPVRVASVAGRSPEEQLALLREYSWSSYHDFVGRRKPPAWLNSAPILALCGGRHRAEQRRAYRRFAEEAVSTPDEETALLLQHHLGVGDDAFLGWVQDQMLESAQRTKRAEDVDLRREEIYLPVHRVLESAAKAFDVDVSVFRERRRNSPLRGVAARVLCTYGGLTQREAAEILGVGTGAAVGQQLRSLEARCRQERSLRQVLDKLERLLQEETEAVNY